ncbi:MAG TPA: regulatory protein RecX [Thermoanaerobaculaceae bacterium]|nr:regulatory protein RecX [Thermoanaerobaculaceae bacterium]
MLQRRRPGGRGAPHPDPGTIHDVALRMLGGRALSRAEVTERLEYRGFQPSVVRAEVARLERAGLLDDAALARAVCQAQLRSGRGRRALTAALRRRRVAREAVALALSELDEEAEGTALAAAFATATRKHKWWRRLPEERRKVVRYLLARGFSLDQVRRALRENGRDEPHGEETDDAGDPPSLP